MKLPLSLVWLAISLVLPVGVTRSQADVRAVGPIGLTVDNLDRETEFFATLLQFEKIAASKATVGAADTLLGLTGTSLTQTELKLGDETILLTEHLTNKGRSIPPDSRSFDHWFQHIAIVVRDMDKAYQYLLERKVRHVSTGPQTLPAWNKNAGGIKAFYFRDPENHVLEIIWYPPGKGAAKWQLPSDKLFLGIDHTAIVVSDTDRSLDLYHGILGMSIAGEAENHGPEQEHLNQVFGARLRITALRAPRGPGIELLEYITPPGGRPLPADAQANDLLFWHPQLIVESLTDQWDTLRSHKTQFVSQRITSMESGTSFIVRDRDGHALQFTEAPGKKVSAR